MAAANAAPLAAAMAAGAVAGGGACWYLTDAQNTLLNKRQLVKTSKALEQATKMVDEYKQARQDAFVERDRLASEVDGLMDRAQRLKGEIAERDKALRALRALGERAESKVLFLDISLKSRPLLYCAGFRLI